MSLLLLLIACSGTPSPPPAETPAPAPTPPTRPAAIGGPDVVIITLDTTRADHLGTYGYFRDTSPAIDAFADGSVVFERLVVPMATTLPTHTSLLTGTWPEEHGVRANVLHDGKRFVQSEQLKSFASVLQDRGYQTGGFISAAPLRAADGIGAGFDTFTEPHPKKMERRASLTVDDALSWLGKATDAPMLMWVHFYDPHNPFKAPSEYTERFTSDAELGRWIDERKISAKAKRPHGEVVRAKAAMNAYDAEIRYMDDQFARLLAGIEARGRADDTLYIVMGDHGEGLNQHGQPGHGLVWGEQLHAPLFIRAPGAKPARIDTLLSVADVMPTALGLQPIEGTTDFLKQTSGRNVLSSEFVARPVLSQMSTRQLKFGKPLSYALTGPQYKCTWDDTGATTLYDLVADPYELTDVAADKPEELARCVKTLTGVLDEQKARGKALGAGKTTDMDPSKVEQLKALGYLDGDAE